MPVDYQSYLLSASPPGFELNYADRVRFPRHCTMDRFNSAPVITAANPTRIKSFFQPCPNYMPAIRPIDTEETLREKESEECQKENSFEQDKISIKNDSDEKANEKSSTGKLRKRVSFADDLGGELVEIRILTQRPDSPPMFKSELISSLTNGFSPSVTDLPPFKLNFSQPASDYVAFRDRIKHNCVALENVILKHYHLMGTVKVKNISFEKKVVIRYTTDMWKSHTDVTGIYVPPNTSGANPYDTFSFEIQISPKMDTRKKLEFAVMYSVNNQQYWDNNDGSNFEVVSSDWKEENSESGSHNTTDKVVFSLEKSCDWTKFSGWSNMNDDVPYY